jgi:hypothetical protein
MTDPNSPDDNWGELYRELGVDDPGLSKLSDDDAEVIELTESEPDEVDEAAQPFGGDGADEIEESAEGEAVSAEGEGEGDPGQKKRRRRRRRRRKKGGSDQPAGEEAAGPDAESEESETQLEEDEGEAITGPGVEEEVTPEMTRDIIANWNVPSWEEIVAGLHRPDR